MVRLILGFVPGLIWLMIFLTKDKHPEPKKMLLKTFVLGALITPLAVLFEYTALELWEISSVLYLFLIIAPVEEILKYFAARTAALKTKFYDEPVDAMIYMITAALGFATVENIILILQDGQNPIDTVILRFLSATLLHALASGIVGYYIARKNLFKGLGLAIIAHGLYNYFALIKTDNALLGLSGTLVIMLIIVSIMFKKLKKY